jgi:hypothetical protein
VARGGGGRFLRHPQVVESYDTVANGSAGRIAPGPGEIAWCWEGGDALFFASWVLGTPVEVVAWMTLNRRVRDGSQRLTDESAEYQLGALRRCLDAAGAS